MDPAAAFANPEEREEVSKRELLSRYCENLKNNRLASEVLRAYESEIKKAVRPVANGLRPERCEREDFFKATLNRTRLKFILGVCGYRGDTPHSWKGWLGEVARTAALEELDFHVHRRWKIPIVEVGPDELFPDDVEKGSEGKEDPWDRIYRSAYHRLGKAEPLPPPDTGIKAEERTSITLRLLVLHAQRSQEDADSANAIRIRYWDDWSVVKIAEYRFGKPMTAGKEKAIRRELDEDYDKLRLLLKRVFGITALSQI